MRYPNAIEFLRSVNEALERDPSSVSEADVLRVLKLHEEAKAGSSEGVENWESALSKRSEVPDDSQTHSASESRKESEAYPMAGCSPEAVFSPPSAVAMPSPSFDRAPAHEERSSPFGASPVPPSATDDEIVLNASPATGRKSSKPSAFRDWDIDSGNEDIVEELNSIEVLSATILARLKDRYVD